MDLEKNRGEEEEEERVNSVVRVLLGYPYRNAHAGLKSRTITFHTPGLGLSFPPSYEHIWA